MSQDTWSPERYERFKAERDRPAHDLVAMVTPAPGGRVVDLGSGTGELTARLHAHVGATETVGVERSGAMLERAGSFAGDGVSFVEADLGPWLDSAEAGARDVVFANASLQWVPDHPALLAACARLLAPGGQIAVQVPANFDHPSHVLADALGAEYGVEPLHRVEAILAPEGYARVLHDLGLVDQAVTLRVYDHPLERTDDVVAWVDGSLLNAYRQALDEAGFAGFRAEYRRRLLAALGDPSGDHPHFYAFKRILFHARRPI